MYNNNPDYPTNTGAFQMHTYNNQFPTGQESFYYNGVNPFQQGQPDSRRNINMGNMQQSQFNGGYQPVFNQTQPQVTNEAQLAPFSSYPPQRPLTPVNGGLNPGLSGSRRNDAFNPAMTMQQPQPTMQVPQQVPSVNPYMETYANYGMTVEPGMQALYAQQQPVAFDRKCCWDNQYTQNRQIEAPVINWNQYTGQMQGMIPGNNLNPTGYGMPQGVPQYNAQPQYPVVANQYPQADKTWLEIAKSNWGV